MSSFCLVGLSRLSRRLEGADVLRWVPRESSAVVVDGGDGSETASSSHISVKDPRRIRAVVALAKNWDTRGTAMIYARLLLICLAPPRSTVSVCLP